MKPLRIVGAGRLVNETLTKIGKPVFSLPFRFRKGAASAPVSAAATATTFLAERLRAPAAASAS